MSPVWPQTRPVCRRHCCAPSKHRLRIWPQGPQRRGPQPQRVLRDRRSARRRITVFLHGHSTGGPTPACGGRPRTGCGYREPSHLMRPPRIRGQGRRAGLVAAAGRPRRSVGECCLQAAADGALGAAGACRSARRTQRQAPAQSQYRSDQSCWPGRRSTGSPGRTRLRRRGVRGCLPWPGCG